MCQYTKHACIYNILASIRNLKRPQSVRELNILYQFVKPESTAHQQLLIKECNFGNLLSEVLIADRSL